MRVTSGPADKWFPWVTARGGRVEALFMDGSYDWPNRNQYGITSPPLKTEEPSRS